MQQWVRDKIRQAFNLQDDDVTSRSMGASGTDVLLSPAAREAFPFSVECKNQQSLNVWKSWEQAILNVDKDCYPLLIIKRNNITPLAVLDASLLFAILEQVHKRG